MTGAVESVNTSSGGVPKAGVFEALITEHGVGGDHQNDARYHGGPDRAVVLFSLDVIRDLQSEGHPIGAGTAGENLTVSGLDWAAIVPGTTLPIGERGSADHQVRDTVPQNPQIVRESGLHANLPGSTPRLESAVRGS